MFVPVTQAPPLESVLPLVHKLASIVVFLGALPVAAAVSEPAVSYRLDYDLGGPSRVEVRVDVAPLSLPRTLVVPRAIPMGYGEQPYDRFVRGVRGLSESGLPLAVTREEGPRWRFDVRGEAADLATVVYEVDVAEMERKVLSAADASKARSSYLGLLGYSVFGFLEGLEHQPIELEVRAPEGWPAFSTLAPSVDGGSVVRTTATGFYALADSQVLMGPDLQLLKAAADPDLYIAAYAEVPLDVAVVASLGQQALAALVDYFGSAPFEHFTMVVEVLDPVSDEHEYGFSMEHMDSATFFLGSDRAIDGETAPAELDRHLYNYAHHIAHSWIPKRCFGKGYFPFSWELAPLLDTIWFSEGFGQYAAAAALAAHLPDRPDYLEQLVDARFRRSLAASPPFIRRMSTIELSRVASTRYGQDFRTGKASFSRGGLMAAEMDAHIRKKSHGKKSLRDALRYLVDWSRREQRPLTLEELPKLLTKGSGVGVREIHEHWMRPRQEAVD